MNTRKELTNKLQITGTHSEDKDLMTIEHLQLLSNKDFTDCSWGNDECASFLSSCGYYQIFVGFADFDETFSTSYIDDEGDVEFINSSCDLEGILNNIDAHRNQKDINQGATK